MPTRPMTTINDSDIKLDTNSNSNVGSMVKFAISGNDLLKICAESPKIGLLNKSSELSVQGRTFKHITAQVDVRGSTEVPSLIKVEESRVSSLFKVAESRHSRSP